MVSNNLKGIIELGNIYFKCIIFQINSNNKSKILSNSMTPSGGIHNGVVVDLVKASNSIRSCIGAAEKKSNIMLKKISVILEQPEFLCTKLSKNRKIDGAKILREDIEFLLREAKKQVIMNDQNQSIIHIFNHNYIVDGKKFIEEPIDVYANYLSHEITFLTMPKNNIKNIEQAFIDCDIEIERYISCTFALAAELLGNNELQYGSMLVDFGYEKISLGLFKNLSLIHSATLPIGVNHIAKDISKVCLLNLQESEIIRNKIDFSFQNNNELFNENGNLKNVFFKDSGFRKISKSLILNIAKARLDEIFQKIKKHIIIKELNLSSGTNLFITGGGSNLLNLEKYCSDFFGFNVKKLYNNNQKGNYKDFKGNFTSCLGALKIITDGWDTEAIPKSASRNSQKIGFFANIFRNLT